MLEAEVVVNAVQEPGLFLNDNTPLVKAIEVKIPPSIVSLPTTVSKLPAAPSCLYQNDKEKSVNIVGLGSVI